MIKLTIPGNPIAKQRPRFSKTGKTYDRQSREKKLVRCLMMKEIADQGYLKRLQEPISVHMTFHTPIPNSWSQKRKESVLGKCNPARPDLDNYVKFYCDVMNDLVYQDDNLITELWCEKKYSDKPKVVITIFEEGNGTMIKEHATTVKGEITVEDLEYMVKKANRIGLRDRELFRVFMEEDSEGKHIYFECDGMGKLKPSREGGI